MRKIITLIICALATFPVWSQDWASQTTGTTTTLRGLSFVSSTTGWAAGNSGVILKTTNGGDTWSTLNSPVTATFRDIFFIDENTGFIGNQSNGFNPGASNTLRKTTDGGNSWTTIPDFTTAASSVWGIHFLDANTGFVAGGTTGSGYIRKTSNGGATWTNVLISLSDYITDVFFVDANNGWATQAVMSSTDDFVIYKTTNGGLNWTKVTISAASGRTFNSLFFIDANTGWGAGGDGSGSGFIYKTTDGGSTWTQNTSLGTVMGQFHDIAFVDANTGWAVGQNDVIYHSVNGGTTWTAQNTGTSFVSFLKIKPINSGLVYTAGGTGRIMKYFVAPPAPAITNHPDNKTVCAGGNTQFSITATDATGYQWQVNQGVGFSNISNGEIYSGATTASLTITGATAVVNGYMYRCVATGATSPAATSNSATLTVSTISTSASQTNIACNGGSNGSATVSATGGTGSYSYSWSPSGGTAATATGLNAGTYTVTVTDANGCTATRDFTITQPAAISTTASQTNISCNGGSNGSATVSATGGTGAYSYSWSPSGGTAATATGLNAGTYTVTVTDANGCTATRDYILTQPAAITTSASQTNVTCNGESDGSASVFVIGGTGAYSYVWSPSGGTDATAIGLISGNYEVKITDDNGCEVDASFTIEEPTKISSTISSTYETCNPGNDGTASVIASGGGENFSYSWSPSGGTSPNAFNLAAGTYMVTITDNNDCQHTNSVIVLVAQNPTINMTNDHSICHGEETLLLASGANSYEWDNEGGSTAEINVSPDHTILYTVIGTDENGCIGTASVEVTVEFAPSPSFTKTIDGLTVEFLNTSENSSEYLWDFGDGSLPVSSNNPLHTYSNPGNYTVKLKAVNDCGPNEVEKVISIITTGMVQKSSGNFVTVMPNPSNGVFTLSIDNVSSSILGIDIVDMKGRVVYSRETNVNTAQHLEHFDLSNIAKGIYYVRINGGQQVKTKMINIQ
ncbi:MAG: T9SS type A sorting domain-containing protein [Cytophagaceae bacterium]